jgi:hypothetical protein
MARVQASVQASVLEFLFLGILEEVAGVEVIHGKSYRD